MTGREKREFRIIRIKANRKGLVAVACNLGDHLRCRRRFIERLPSTEFGVRCACGDKQEDQRQGGISHGFELGVSLYSPAATDLPNFLGKDLMARPMISIENE